MKKIPSRTLGSCPQTAGFCLPGLGLLREREERIAREAEKVVQIFTQKQSPIFNSTPIILSIMAGHDRPLPKFGEWDVNDPASAEGFTVIFNKARNEKRTGGKPDSPQKRTGAYNKATLGKPQSKKWFCCVNSAATE